MPDVKRKIVVNKGTPKPELDRATTKSEKREKQLKGIFDFYSRQQLMVGKKATFEEIQKVLDNMTLGEFVRFCLDFQVPIKKQKIMEIFKKVSVNHREITYDQFKEILQKLFIEVNRLKVKNLKKKLDSIDKTNVIGTAIFKDIKKQLLLIKNKSSDEIMEECYIFLELDFP